MQTAPVRVDLIAPDHPDSVLGVIDARSQDGLDLVEIRVRWDAETGPGRALLMLARASLEVVVRLADFRREPVVSREAEGSRWHG